MLSPLPRRTCSVRISLASLTVTAFPGHVAGRRPHLVFRGLLSVQSHYGLHARQIPYRTFYTRGFSRFIASTTALIATGRSERSRAGFAPAGSQRLSTAHTCRHSSAAVESLQGSHENIVSLHEKINDFAKSLFLQEYDGDIQEYRAESVELGHSVAAF
jgi:hypothetical protein